MKPNEKLDKVNPPKGYLYMPSAEPGKPSLRSIERAARIRREAPFLSVELAEGNLTIGGAERILKYLQADHPSETKVQINRTLMSVRDYIAQNPNAKRFASSKT